MIGADDGPPFHLARAVRAASATRHRLDVQRVGWRTVTRRKCESSLGRLRVARERVRERLGGSLGGWKAHARVVDAAFDRDGEIGRAVDVENVRGGADGAGRTASGRSTRRPRT